MTSDTGYSLLPAFIGATALVWEDTGDWGGSAFVILYRDSQYGFLSFEYGSWSCCDAWKAAEGDPEAQQMVLEDLSAKIVWFDTLRGVQDYVQSRDAGVEPGAYGDVWTVFVAQVVNL